MPATFTFDLPSAAGCMARPCGEGHRCFLLLTDAAKQKSADGSGVLIGTIISVLQVNLTLWRFVVEVANSEFLSAPSVNEMQLSLSCMDAESDALLRKIQSSAEGAGRLDVWSPDMLWRGNETVTSGVVGAWVGVVPRPFAASYLRLSCRSNSGKTLGLSLDIGLSAAVLAQLTWNYVVNEDSRLFPFSAWGSSLSSNVLPAGARVLYSTALSGGSYGNEMKGLKLDFIGRWIS